MNKFERLKLRILQAIFSNDEEAFSAILQPPNGLTNSDMKRLKKVLHEQHSFTPLGERFDDQMLTIFQKMLVNSAPAITPSSHSESGKPPSRQLLDAYLKTYRGHVIHIAAALNRVSIIRKLLETLLSHRCFLLAKAQVECEDGEGHTALVVAVLGQCDDTVRAMCFYLNLFFLRKKSFAILQDAVSQTTSLLPKMPRLQNAVSALLEKAGEVWTEECQTLTSKHASYHWPIVLCDLALLQAQVRRGRLMTKKDDLPALHFAVIYYTGSGLDNKRRDLLRYLITCPDGFREEKKVSLNDVHKLILTKDAQLSGSAAHFAVYQIAGFYRQKVARNTNAHTFEAEESRPDTEKDAVPEISARKRRYLDMLEFLQEQGADFTLVNPEGLTVLDILPADSDQQIINKVRALMQTTNPPAVAAAQSV